MLQALLFALVVLPAPGAARVRVQQKELDQGSHFRIAAPAGVIHVLKPKGYRRKDAGVVLYVHGFNNTVDKTWRDDALAEQLTGSGLNAVFIAVAAPRSLMDTVKFPDLERVLALVSRHTGRLPNGRVVAVGHSGGYWTIANWLDEKRLERIILLDGMYGFVAEYKRWLAADRRRRLVFVARGTARLSRSFIRGQKGVAIRDNVPGTFKGFTRRQRNARIVHMRSQFSHSGIVKSGKVIPVVLPLSGIARVGPKADPSTSN
jgi:alpha-beta hydrolase superfamily lysophospholipase